LQRFKAGQIVLINETPSDSSPNKLKASQSILVLNDKFDNEDVTEAQKTTPKVFRGIVIDESIDKCVVQNIDNGKKLVLKKSRVMPLSQSCDEAELTPKANSRILLQIIPFMTIKAKPCEEINCPQVKRVLKNSRYYGEEIKLNLGKPKTFFQ
jgi:hypothetical protein